ncbi:hypothetical protein M8C21_013289, partial [Ambrosia artemisiifolia]
MVIMEGQSRRSMQVLKRESNREYRERVLEGEERQIQQYSCGSESRWDELNIFFDETGAAEFGLDWSIFHYKPKGILYCVVQEMRVKDLTNLKSSDYPQFQAVAIAMEKSGF